MKRKRIAVFVIFTAITCINPYSSDFSGSLVTEVKLSLVTSFTIYTVKIKSLLEPFHLMNLFCRAPFVLKDCRMNSALLHLNARGDK